jgi:hypothetical protein
MIFLNKSALLNNFVFHNHKKTCVYQSMYGGATEFSQPFYLPVCSWICKHITEDPGSLCLTGHRIGEPLQEFTIDKLSSNANYIRRVHAHAEPTKQHPTCCSEMRNDVCPCALWR